MAHKKAAGSAKNLRTSKPKYRGVKLFGGQTARAGNIVIRQKGDVYQLGKNVYKGNDFTIHAAIDGVVLFRKKNITRFDGSTYLKTVVDVMPVAADARSSTAKANVSKSPSTKAVKTTKPAVDNVEDEETIVSDVDTADSISSPKPVAKKATTKATGVAAKGTKVSKSDTKNTTAAAKPKSTAKKPVAKTTAKKA